MADEKTYTLEEAQLHFAKSIHGRVWELLEREGRSPAEAEEMLHAAHASLYHWIRAGTGLHHQRGVWLIARVHTVLGNTERAVSYANHCREITEQDADLMQDFDLAFSYECAARAFALAGDRDQAAHFLGKAEQAGAQIADEEDRVIFFDELNSGEWHGLR
jgi:hypothetical protein